jgi:sirohydrochlorin cobaltochelatase
MKMDWKYQKPLEIEQRSFEIIREELRCLSPDIFQKMPPEMLTVLVRIIHSTADFSFAESLCASPNATARAIDALRAGVSIVFMGHGAEHPANSVYAKLDAALKSRGFPNYHIGTVEARPSLDDVIAAIGKTGVRHVVLQPLMIVAGDHAHNDMAGSEDDSWKNVLESKGYKVTIILKGLGEDASVQQMFVRHVGEAKGE